jgi:hypothetical protein
VNNEFEGIGSKVVAEFRFYTGIFLEGLLKGTDNLVRIRADI